jgi:lipopolysaccharide biosynthesis protein
MTLFRKVGTFLSWILDSEKSLDDFRKKSNWSESQLIEELDRNAEAQQIALTAHVFYKEFASEFISALRSISQVSKVYISTPSEQIKEQLDSFLSSSRYQYDVRVTPNRGRNFGPLLVEFSKELLKEKSFIHVHSKKSLHSPDFAADWLSRNTKLLLSESGIQRIRALTQSDPQIGLAFVDASDLLYGTNFRWGRSLSIAQEIFAKSRGFEKIKWSGRLSFPAGGMFWVKTEAIRPLLEIEWSYEMFPVEEGQMDGTLQHAIERVIGQLPISNGFSQAAYIKSQDRFKRVGANRGSTGE